MFGLRRASIYAERDVGQKMNVCVSFIATCLVQCCLQRVGLFFFFQAEDGIRDYKVTGVQTCALPI